MSRKPKMTRASFLFGSAFALAAPLLAQQDNGHGTTTIDGSKTPELIPDMLAYRNYFFLASVPANASREQIDHQSRHIARIGFKFTLDNMELVAALRAFRDKFDAAVADYNVKAMKGQGFDQKVFFQELDSLTLETWLRLNRNLTPLGATHLQRFIQEEKKHIVQVTEVGGGQ